LFSKQCRVAFFVTDYYLPSSIKSLERKRPSAIGSLRMKILQRNQTKIMEQVLAAPKIELKIGQKIKAILHSCPTENCMSIVKMKHTA